MAHIFLVTGGCRSGKSAYAQKLAESLPKPRAFLATCQPCDDEMRARVRRHRSARSESRWTTIEEPLDLAGILGQASGPEVILVDCLTLWVANVVHQWQEQGSEATEDRIAARCEEMLEACNARPGTVVFVTNEVGMSIVPQNRLGRLFRDLLGRCNQVVAAAANEVTLMSCGLPLTLKSQDGLPAVHETPKETPR